MYKRSYHNLNFIRIWPEKLLFFFERWSWFRFNDLGLALRCTLEILHQSVKRVKTKSRKVLGANSYVCRSYRGKTGILNPSWIGLRLLGSLLQVLNPTYNRLCIPNFELQKGNFDFLLQQFVATPLSSTGQKTSLK